MLRNVDCHRSDRGGRRRDRKNVGAAVASRLIERSGGPHRPGGQGLHHRESGVDSFADGFHRFKVITRQPGEKFQLFCPGDNLQLPSSGATGQNTRTMLVIPTEHGLRLTQHGVVLSELRTSPGPTHSVFDVLAASIAVLAPAGRVGVLGFAGGGMMAPLRALGVTSVIHSVDLDRSGYDLFCQHCPQWRDGVNWQQADAVAWLQQQSSDFDLLLDDLSVPQNDDVFKPAVSWEVLPELINTRLRPGGFGVFNLLPAPDRTWKTDVKRIVGRFHSARLVKLEDFENRILIAGGKLPDARSLGAQLRQILRQLGSKQADRMQMQTLR